MYILALLPAFSPPWFCAPPQFVMQKSATRRKKSGLLRKSPHETTKNGELFGKSCAPAHTARFPIFGTSPSTASSAPLSPPRSHVCSISPHLHRPLRAVLSSTPHAAARNAPAAHTGKDVRLDLHAPMPEDAPMHTGKTERTQRMIEKQTRKCHKIRTRARVRRFELREWACRHSAFFEKCRRTDEK